MYRPTRPGSAAAKKKYEGWRFHQPSLPWSSHHTLQHGAFLRADQVPGDVLRLRSVPSRVSRQGLSASVGPREPIKVAFDGSLSRFPCPKARVPLDVVGKWERHRFSPLPHALPSIALPVARTVAILADVRHFRGGSGQKLSSVSGAILPRHEMEVAPVFGVAPSEFCLWTKRIPGITFRLDQTALISRSASQVPAMNRPLANRRLPRSRRQFNEPGPNRLTRYLALSSIASKSSIF